MTPPRVLVVLDPARPGAIPSVALPHLTGAVDYTADVTRAHRVGLPERTVGADVLVTCDASRESGDATVIVMPRVSGDALLDAVDVMDRLRRRGPWEQQQTHDSLRRYLLEETYELLDALDGDDRAELRAELGDVLLQVLFHSRVAQDDPVDPFSIDDVASALVTKLRHRTPLVLSAEGEVDMAEQVADWERRKAQEKPRESCLDGIATGAPALALAQKVLSRARAAGFPESAIPAELRQITLSPDVDAEDELRRAVFNLMGRVRDYEKSALP